MVETGARPVKNAMRRGPHGYLIVIPVLLLAGCSVNDNADLHDKIRAIKAQPAGKIPPLPVFEQYRNFPYSAKNEKDPFKSFFSGNEESNIVASDIKPPMLEDRKPEALEEYPLDTLRYVGQLVRDGDEWAIVTSPDKVVHRVKTGNHLGKNFGKIVQILEDKILIEETIADERGRWIKRDAALSLME